VTNANPTVKLIGFGMAVAVLIDSTLLRMVLVPAVMELFGKAAWWFPRWLEWIPHVNIEGTPEPTPEPEPEPEPVATSPSLDPSPTGS
jgi:RND superfamily putative drug exporter